MLFLQLALEPSFRRRLHLCQDCRDMWITTQCLSQKLHARPRAVVQLCLDAPMAEFTWDQDGM